MINGHKGYLCVKITNIVGNLDRMNIGRDEERSLKNIIHFQFDKRSLNALSEHRTSFISPTAASRIFKNLSC
jgi:hypothetical protein